MNSHALTYAVATPAEHRQALELVLSCLAPSARGPLLDETRAARGAPLGVLDALVVARAGAAIEAAAWVQPQPGRCASLWPPVGPRPGRCPPPQVCERLLGEALRPADAAGIDATQALFEAADDPRIASCESAGFRWIADLLYLGRRVLGSEPGSSANGHTEFEPYDDLQYTRLRRLVESTYVESLDCPGLEGLRSTDDVLAGYRATGRFDPANWFILVHHGQDAGVLLLAEHPDSDQLELVYMGLRPEHRGRGLGGALVERASLRAAELGADQLMVAVDAANSPARRVYERAGFAPWATRRVLLRPRGAAAPGSPAAR